MRESREVSGGALAASSRSVRPSVRPSALGKFWMGAQVLPTPLHPLRSPLGTEDGMQATFSGLLVLYMWCGMRPDVYMTDKSHLN